MCIEFIEVVCNVGRCIDMLIDKRYCVKGVGDDFECVEVFGAKLEMY